MRKRGIVKKEGIPCEVAVIRHQACGENCASCGGCRLSETVILAENTVGARVGDKVIVEIPDKTALSAAWLVYLLPIVVMIICLLAGYTFKIGEGSMAILALAVLAVSFFAVQLYTNRHSNRFKVKITEILN